MPFRFKGVTKEELCSYLGDFEKDKLVVADWVPEESRSAFKSITLEQAIKSANVFSYSLDELDGLAQYLAKLRQSVYSGRVTLAEISFLICKDRQRQVKQLVEAMRKEDLCF